MPLGISARGSPSSDRASSARRWRSPQNGVADVQVRAIDKGQSLSQIGDALVVVLAAPVNAILETLPQLPLIISPRALVIDTGSTKHAIMKAAAAAKRSLTSSAVTRWPAGRALRRCAPGAIRRAPVVSDQSRCAGSSAARRAAGRSVWRAAHRPSRSRRGARPLDGRGQPSAAGHGVGPDGDRRPRGGPRQPPMGRHRPSRHHAAGLDARRRCGRACWPATATS